MQLADENIGDKALISEDIPAKLSVRQRLSIRVFGEVFIGYRKPLGYSEYVRVYLVQCPKHGLFYATASGHQKKMQCVKCMKKQLDALGLI